VFCPAAVEVKANALITTRTIMFDLETITFFFKPLLHYIILLMLSILMLMLMFFINVINIFVYDCRFFFSMSDIFMAEINVRKRP